MTMLLFDLQGFLRDLIPVAFILLGLITFRLRGSGLWDLYTGTGTTGGRAQYAILMALAAVLLTRDWRLVDLAVMFFLGCIPPWFADGLVPLTPRRFAVNALRGVLWLAPAAAALWWHGYPGWHWLLAAGPFSAPIYWLAWHVPFPAIRRDGDEVIAPGTALAEAMYGGWIGYWLHHALTVPATAGG